jgi:hypothetical protein
VNWIELSENRISFLGLHAYGSYISDYIKVRNIFEPLDYCQLFKRDSIMGLITLTNGPFRLCD